MTAIVEAVPLEQRWLRLTFADGSVHEVDVAGLRAGVFAEIHANDEVFRSVRVNRRFGTVEWPGGVDLDPDVLHGDRDLPGGGSYPRRIVRGPRERRSG